jgi:hypothetical protein
LSLDTLGIAAAKKPQLAVKEIILSYYDEPRNELAETPYTVLDLRAWPKSRIQKVQMIYTYQRVLKVTL